MAARFKMRRRFTHGCFFQKYRAESLRQLKMAPDRVIPAWSAEIQIDMEVSEGILAKLDFSLFRVPSFALGNGTLNFEQLSP